MGTMSPFGAWLGQGWNLTASELRDAARRLEDAGYREVWISEAFGREVFTAAGILLAATDSLGVGTGIANMWVRDPMAMANAGRTLAEAYPGRVMVAVGVSHRPLVDRRGHDYDSPLDLAHEYLAAMEAAAYRAPAPPVDPVILVGALGDRMLRLAAETTDGAHPYLVTPEHTGHARDVLGPDRVLAPEQAFVLTTDPDTARRVGRAHLATYLALDNYVRSLGRQGFGDEDLADGGSDRLVDAIVAWGDPSTVLDRVKAHWEAGADHVAVQPLADDALPGPIDQLLTMAPVLRAATA